MDSFLSDTLGHDDGTPGTTDNSKRSSTASTTTTFQNETNHSMTSIGSSSTAASKNGIDKNPLAATNTVTDKHSNEKEDEEAEELAASVPPTNDERVRSVTFDVPSNAPSSSYQPRRPTRATPKARVSSYVLDAHRKNLRKLEDKVRSEIRSTPSETGAESTQSSSPSPSKPQGSILRPTNPRYAPAPVDRQDDFEDLDQKAKRKSFIMLETLRLANFDHQLDDDSDDADEENMVNDGKNDTNDDRQQSSFVSCWQAAYTKLFGSNYNQRQSTTALIAGGLIAFNNGYVNGSCLSGLLLPNGAKQSVAGFTSAYTKSALELAEGDFRLFGYHSGIILSYMIGAALAGYITPFANAYRIEPTYGPTFLIGGVFLLVSSILSALDYDEKWVFFSAAAANGIQNGIASIYSANLIRCSLTGASTDIALVVGQIAGGNYSKLWKGAVLSMIVSSFWLGGVVSFFATSYFRDLSLLFNAALFWLVGVFLVVFLVNELQISFVAAVFGTWKWKHALKKLHKRMLYSRHGSSILENDDLSKSVQALESEEFEQLFDRIDSEGKGVIDDTDLLVALDRAGYDASDRDVRALMMSADANNDGQINRDEWLIMCRTVRSASAPQPSGLFGSIRSSIRRGGTISGMIGNSPLKRTRKSSSAVRDPCTNKHVPSMSTDQSTTKSSSILRQVTGESSKGETNINSSDHNMDSSRLGAVPEDVESGLGSG